MDRRCGNKSKKKAESVGFLYSFARAYTGPEGQPTVLYKFFRVGPDIATSYFMERQIAHLSSRELAQMAWAWWLCAIR
jgi:hypothetical protein